MCGLYLLITYESCFVLSTYSELQERSAQLTLNLAQANEAVQAVASERDTLRTVLQEHEAEKERLQVQLQDRDRQMSDLKQVHADQVRYVRLCSTVQ